jgi:hypothetical protein
VRKSEFSASRKYVSDRPSPFPDSTEGSLQRQTNDEPDEASTKLEVRTAEIKKQVLNFLSCILAWILRSLKVFMLNEKQLEDGETIQTKLCG